MLEVVGVEKGDEIFGDGTLAGLAKTSIRFEYTGGGPACEYNRTHQGLYTPTSTPTLTPIRTPIRDFG